MSYKKWNEALVKHYFVDDNNDEVLLYVDESIINEVGKKNNLGDYDNFLKSILVDGPLRTGIYDDVIQNYPSRTTEINRKIQVNNIFKFPWILASTPVKSKINLPYFNYVVLAITAQTVAENSYYQTLNSIIKKWLPENNKINSLEQFDEIFAEIEKKKPQFKNRQIGNYRYLGLIKYQVVLSPVENIQLEKILFENRIKASEETYFIDFANKILPFISRGSLREKVIKGATDKCYADWFLNKAIQFDHSRFREKVAKDNPEQISVIEKADFAFGLNPSQDPALTLHSNISHLDNGFYEDKEYFIDLPETRISREFSPIPVQYRNSKKLHFKQHSLETSDFSIQSLEIKDVNFFQKASGNIFLQTLTPQENFDIIIVVRNDFKVISRWENWKTQEKNAENVSDKILNDQTKQIFGTEWVVYQCMNGSIKNSYYNSNKENFISKVAYTGDDIDLEVRPKGGYRIPGKTATYVDVSLPFFEINFPDFSADKLEIKIEKPFDQQHQGDLIASIDYNLITLSIAPNFPLSVSTHFRITFLYNGDQYKKIWDFNVEPSLMLQPDDSSFFKMNRWGRVTDSNSLFYNNLSLMGSSLICVNQRLKHKLQDIYINNEPREFSNYFLHLLAGQFWKKENDLISKSDLNSVIASTLEFYQLKKEELIEDEFSKSNLIKNLIALGYINKRTSTDYRDFFQLNPPSFHKIERSFRVNGAQVYKLVGAQTKLFTQKLIQYCDENNLEYKFISFSPQNLKILEYALLPDTLLIEGTFRPENFFLMLEEENLDLFFVTEEKHHVGDSLLHFISSIKEFEQEFLTGRNQISYDPLLFEDPDRSTFPRIRKNKHTSRFSPVKKQYLEIKDGKIVDIPFLQWAKLYIKYTHAEKILWMRRPRMNAGKPLLFPHIYLDKYQPIPSILHKALVQTNHNLPKEVKMFIVNNPLLPNYAFSVFYRYNVGSAETRRERILEILTGESNYHENQKVCLLEEINSEFEMFFHQGNNFTSDFSIFITIVHGKRVIALSTLKSKLYLNPEFLDGNYDNLSKIELSQINEPTDTLKMVELQVNDNINTILSMIINQEKQKLIKMVKNSRITIEKKLNYSTIEKIEIYR